MIYTETVTRLRPITEQESIEVPEELVKLVRSRDPKYGRNGSHYRGRNRERQGGKTIDRLWEYTEYHKDYCEASGHPCGCPVKV